jgi:hypothetical protein
MLLRKLLVETGENITNTGQEFQATRSSFELGPPEYKSVEFQI